MARSTISIAVDDALARAFNNLAPQEQRKLELLLSIRLRDLLTLPAKSLTQLMDEIAAHAKANGLTPEELESILQGYAP